MPGEALAPLPAAMLLLRPRAVGPASAAAPVSPAPPTPGPRGSHPLPLELPSQGKRCILEKVTSSGPGDGTFFFIWNEYNKTWLDLGLWLGICTVSGTAGPQAKEGFPHTLF